VRTTSITRCLIRSELSLPQLEPLVTRISNIAPKYARAEPRNQAMDFVRLNYSDGFKDVIITIDSTWTPAGIDPPEPGPALAAEAEAA
jgi:hypothetical protein